MPSQSSHKRALVLSLIAIFTVFGLFLHVNAEAATLLISSSTSSIQSKIDEKNQSIKTLEKEIASYQSQINALSGQASTLSSAVKSLQLTQKKLADDIKLTDAKINAKNLEIQQLSGKITKSQSNIDDDKRIIMETFATIYKGDNRSVIETLLNNDSISGILDSFTRLGIIQNELFDRISSFSKSKIAFQSSKSSSEKVRLDLFKLNKQKKDQQSIVKATTLQQNTLLNDTKQSQAQYQRVLAYKLQQQQAFEQELLDYQSQLKTLVDKSALPKSGSILSWPLDDISITQYFGNTAFSTANPQIYNGKGHTGVDFRASIGTPVKAALSGIVFGTGNTDLVPGCYSFGKWVMIKHSNGLSTLYAHLSLPVVSTGMPVSTGDIIGYSGNTGYTTGPHLHFGVYASQGVVIQQLTTSTNCHNAVIPIAPFSAYLNPLSYLP